MVSNQGIVQWPDDFQCLPAHFLHAGLLLLTNCFELAIPAAKQWVWHFLVTSRRAAACYLREMVVVSAPWNGDGLLCCKLGGSHLAQINNVRDDFPR